MVESRQPGNMMMYPANNGDVKLAMGDYFDGFNLTYSIFYDDHQQGAPGSLKYYYPTDIQESFIIDPVTKINEVEFAFLFETYHLFLFYDANDLMQVSWLVNDCL